MRKRRWLIFIPLALILVLVLVALAVVPLLLSGGAPGPGVERRTVLDVSSPARIHPSAYAMPSGQAFEGQITFGNETGIDMSYALLCLVDYRQTPCVKGQAEPVARFSLANGARQQFDMVLPPLPDGAHDLLVLVFYVPDAHSTDPQFRADSRFLFTFDRANLFVGESKTFPAASVQTFGAPDKNAEQGMSALALTHPSQPDRAWHGTAAPAGQPVDFTLVWANPDQQPRRFAAIGLLDYKQTPVFSGQPAVFGVVGPGQRADIPARLTASEAGPHELVALVVETPFVDMTTLAEAGAGLAAPAHVYSADRVLVEVK